SIHHNDWISGANKRLIKSRHYFSRPIGRGPDNYALGVHKVIHSGSFAEKLGVGNYIELILTKMFGHRSMDTVSSTDRHGRFIDNHGIIIEHAAQLPGHFHDGRQISLAIATRPCRLAHKYAIRI